MVNKIIIDGNNYNLNESTVFPFTYEFSRAGVHNVKIGLENTNDICAYAFKNCTDLTKVTFPSIITGIKRNAFENCSKLTNIVIPEHIKYVGPNVFDGCFSLSEIQFTKYDTTDRLDPPDIFYSTLENSTICYIPDGSKYYEVSDYNELVKDGSVQYYQKDKIGKYNSVDYELLEEGVNYSYSPWTKIHDYLNVIEERFRVRPTSITFTYNGMDINTFEQVYASTEDRTMETYPIELGPDNITNTKYTYISSNTNLVNVDPNTGEFTISKNSSGTAIIYACTEPFYDGTYISARLSVRVDKLNSGLAPKDNITSFEIPVGSRLDLNTLIDNPNNLDINFILENSRYFNIIDDHYLISNSVGRTCTITVNMNVNNLYQQTSFELRFTSINSEKQNPQISLNKSTYTFEYNAEKISALEISNTNNLPLTYSSSNTELCTINENGDITWVNEAYGETTITIEFAGNDTYYEVILTCKLIVNAPISEETPDIEVEYDSDNGEIQIINPDAEPDIINEYDSDNGEIQVINGD